MEKKLTLPKNYYDSAKRPHPFIEVLKSVILYRDLLVLFISRAIKMRYKRSSLGILWTLLNPLATMLVFTLIFSTLWRFDVESYPIYVLCGLTVWNFFYYTTTTGMTDMVFQGDLLKRIYVPRSVFVLSAAGTGLVNFLIATLPLLLIALVLGVFWQPSLFFLPVAMLINIMFATGVGLLLAAGAIFFTDLIPMFGVISQIWMYCTPLFYPIQIIPEKFLWLFKLNPMYYMVEVYRLPVLSGVLPSLGDAAIAAGWALGTLLIGWFVFTLNSNEYAYRA
jgi:ABC-type polysaccharide/polyol phosphate export permease